MESAALLDIARAWSFWDRPLPDTVARTVSVPANPPNIATPDEVAAAWNAGHGSDAPARVQQSSAESFDLAGTQFTSLADRKLRKVVSTVIKLRNRGRFDG